MPTLHNASSSRARSLYPDTAEQESNFYDYGPIIRSFGTVLIQVEDEDYSGDTRVLLKTGECYGVLIVGWGSCSGCDALQSCSTYAEVDELINRIESDIRWFDSLEEAKAYIADDDERSLSFFGSGEKWAEFQQEVFSFQEPN